MTTAQQEILRIEGLHKYFGDLEVLKGIDLSVNKGEVVALLGSSGSGKSTMLRCINFMEIPSAGKIIFKQQLIGKEKDHNMTYNEKELVKVRANLGMVFQHFNLFPHLKVIENVMEGPKTVLKLSKEECLSRAYTYLDKVGLRWKAQSYPSDLSGGQQQRIAIARALAMEPDLILFDEPTSALDPELVGEVLESIKELADEGTTMMIVTHELGFAYTIANQIIFLSEGKILEQGHPKEVLLKPKQEATRNFLRGHNSFRLPEPELNY